MGEKTEEEDEEEEEVPCPNCGALLSFEFLYCSDSGIFSGTCTKCGGPSIPGPSKDNTPCHNNVCPVCRPIVLLWIWKIRYGRYPVLIK